MKLKNQNNTFNNAYCIQQKLEEKKKDKKIKTEGKPVFKFLKIV